MVRLRCSDDLYALVARRLTERDRSICEMAYEHRVLTTDQICDLAFDNLVTARHRLAVLHHLRLLDRFRPRRDVGSAPAHYILDELGASVVAASRGLERDELPWRRDRALAIATSQRLGHLLGVNSFFCALARASRRRHDAQLLAWRSERRCAAEWEGLVRPDGYGRWQEAGAEVAFFLEYDAGTERLARLAAKLEDYAELALSGEPVLVLFSFLTKGREREARGVLRGTEARVATAVLRQGVSPAEAIWAPLGTVAERRRLAQLAETQDRRRGAVVTAEQLGSKTSGQDGTKRYVTTSMDRKQHELMRRHDNQFDGTSAVP
jgi:hypothetical protein